MAWPVGLMSGLPGWFAGKCRRNLLPSRRCSARCDYRRRSSVTIHEYLTTFAGLPVVGLEEQSPADPAAVAWRIDMEFESDAQEFASAFAQLLERSGPSGPTAL